MPLNRKQKDDPVRDIPERKRNKIEMGYLGTNLHLPYNALKYQLLTKKEQVHNKKHSHIRIVVEHVFTSLKQWRILSHRFRNALKTYNAKFVIVAGLYNLKHNQRNNADILS